ncbi:hypothetical protein [Lacibacter sp.]|uniref:hypothetical protein n=1 Tax=Lacibacter sp. TaxID=1915409 RepID=UPI002B4AFA09|nr:hypothetical protein [Lacibacter sp.]HLP37960.1 hypothetical protein [Lacibacter sp.]
MKRVVFIAVFILIILLVFIYVFIPSTITNSKTVSVKCIDKNILLLVGNKQGWIKWLPKESFTSDLIQYKDYQLKLGGATYTSVTFDALKEDDTIFNEIGFVKDSVTKTKITLISSIATGMNPFTRFRKWQMMKKYDTVIDELLLQLISFAEDRKNIYGVDITDGRIPDSLFISIRKTFNHHPSEAEVYEMIDQLGLYANTKNAKQVNPPMMHIEQLDTSHFEIMVALPIDKVIDNAGNFSFKQMVKGNTLIAEVHGGRATINNGLKSLEQFKSDYQFTSPAISFELMITDRRAERDTAKWVTRLYYPIF